MTQSKYQEAIDLHNKAIDILEKRQKALQKLVFLEESISAYNEGREFEVRVYKLNELNFNKSVQERYIKLLTRAYGRLAASVCAEVAAKLATWSTDNKSHSLRLSNNNLTVSDFEVISDGNDFHVEKLSTDEQKAD